MGTTDRNLIFVLCQPRSGSTLLQHVIGAHTEVETAPEPWFLLHLVFWARPAELEAPYSSAIAHLATREFLQRTPDGEATYRSAMREMALELYDAARRDSKARYFLDKTTRYYFIIDDLVDLFPEAKYIFLYRNPLAIFSSTLHTVLEGRIDGLMQVDRIHDLVTAPRLLLAGRQRLEKRAISMRYEDLVDSPAEQSRRVCTYLELPFQDGMLEYGDKVDFRGARFVDPKSVYRHSTVSPEYTDCWERNLDTPQKLHLALGYLDDLGRDVVQATGYDFEALRGGLEARLGHRRPAPSWSRLTGRPVRRRPWARWLGSAARLARATGRAVSRRGMTETFKAIHGRLSKRRQ